MDEKRSERAIDYFYLRGPEGTDSVVIDMVGVGGPNDGRQLGRLTIPIYKLSSCLHQTIMDVLGG